jgi:hypothetical protein
MYTFLIKFLFKADEIPLWRHPPPQYIFLIQFLFKINENTLWSPDPPLLFQYMFLIQFLFKTNENTLWSPHPSSSNTCSLFNSYSKLMKIKFEEQNDVFVCSWVAVSQIDRKSNLKNKIMYSGTLLGGGLSN